MRSDQNEFIHNILFISFTVIIGSFLISCDRQYKENQSIKANAFIESTSEKKNKENNIQGSVTFTQPKAHVNINVEINGLQPNKKYAVHIHENGDCSNKAKAAGGHFNPLDNRHSGLKRKISHAGDLGNLETNDEGTIKATINTDKISLKEQSQTFIVGKAFIIHGGIDDLVSQPSGNAGPRIGCGIITAVNPDNESNKLSE